MKDLEIPVLTDQELPCYATSGASGADVRARLDGPVVIEPGKTKVIPTGLFFEIPEGYEIQVRPRSGLAFRHQVTVLNSPGTIDSDYRGELMLIIINHGKKPFVVESKMRLAQIVVAPVVQARFIRVHELISSERGSGAFGSTGVE